MMYNALIHFMFREKEEHSYVTELTWHKIELIDNLYHMIYTIW